MSVTDSEYPVEEDRIALVKRKILLSAMPVGALASLGAYLNLGNIPGATGIDYAAHATLTIVLLLLTALLFWRPRLEFPVMVGCVLSLAGCFGLRIFLALFGPNSEMPIEQVFPPVYGFVPLIFVLIFVVAPRRAALLLSMSFYLTTAAFVIVYAARHLELLASTPMLGVIVQQYVVAHGLYIALLYIIPMIQREYEGAVIERENVRREQELEARERAQRERLDVALSASKMGLWELNVQTGRLLWDSGVYRLLDIDQEVVPEPRMADLLKRVHPEDRSGLQRMLLGKVANVDGTGGQKSSDLDTAVRLLIPGHGARVMAMRGRIYADDHGSPIRVAGVAWDITDEEARREELERSNRELREFAFVASHDLKEPLRGIRGFTELLARRLEGSLDDESRDYVEYINSGVLRANNLIEALLEYSRIGRNPLNLQAIDCNELLEEVQRGLHVQVAESRAKITVQSLPRVLGDASQLSRLFQNLISNAIHYCKLDERPRITVKAYQADNEWVFSVSDNGIGIAAEHLERIFQIFQRLDKTRVDGTGIGLAVCKKIVDRHNGRLWVESEPGIGTTFSFTLPFTRPEVLDSYEQGAKTDR